MDLMETEDQVQELRRALLEIEWTSRRSTTRATLRKINNIARAALVAQTTTASQAAEGLMPTGAELESDLELRKVKPTPRFRAASTTRTRVGSERRSSHRAA
jgi:hypothetical protein